MCHARGIADYKEEQMGRWIKVEVHSLLLILGVVVT